MDRVHLPPELGARLADVLAREVDAIASEWLDEIRRRLSLRPNRIFPSDELLDDMPELVRQVVGSLAAARFGGGPATEHVRRLVELRRSQGYSLEELLVEADLLATLVFRRLQDVLAADVEASGPEGVAAAGRISHAVRELRTRIGTVYGDREGDRSRRHRLLLATLQHELRNPLSVVSHTATALERAAENGKPPAEEDLHLMGARLGRAVDRARELIASLPAVAEPGEIPERGPLVDVVTDVLSDVRDFLPGRRVELLLEREIPELEVDRTNTALVLHNLVTNAIKYADPDKDRRWVRIEVTRGEMMDEWIVRVGDNGLGVPLDRQEAIFERFVRAHEERASGHGLGLAIARAAVERMGGRIGLESREGEGTTFFFTVRDLTSGAGAG